MGTIERSDKRSRNPEPESDICGPSTGSREWYVPRARDTVCLENVSEDRRRWCTDVVDVGDDRLRSEFAS